MDIAPCLAFSLIVVESLQCIALCKFLHIVHELIVVHRIVQCLHIVHGVVVPCMHERGWGFGIRISLVVGLRVRGPPWSMESFANVHDGK